MQADETRTHDRRAAHFVLPALLALSVLGCRTAYVEAQHAIAAPDGRVWITGSEGFAAVADGNAIARADYPTPGPDSAYEVSSSFPAARALVVGRSIWLITRGGEVMHAGTRGWERLPVSLGPEGDYPPQVNYAAVHPDGRVVLHIHSETIAWVDPMKPARAQIEAMPAYMDPVTLVGAELFGVGWVGRSEQRVLRRRTGPGAWEDVARLPMTELRPKAIGRWGDELVVVGGEGVFVGSAGELAPVTIKDLFAPPRRSPVIAVDPEAQLDPAPRRAFERVSDPPAIATEPEPVLGPTYIVSASHDPSGRLFLQVSGARTGIVDLRERTPRFYPCSFSGLVAGVVDARGSLLAVDGDATLLSLDTGGCDVRASGLLAEPSGR